MFNPLCDGFALFQQPSYGNHEIDLQQKSK